MPRRTPTKGAAALSAVAATALLFDPSSTSSAGCFCHAFTPSLSGTPAGPLHLLNANEAATAIHGSLVPQNSLVSDRRTVRRPTSTSSHFNGRMTLALHATKKGGGDIDYANMTPQVYPQRWVQLAYLSLLALLVSPK
jgi:hypothetical protein